MRNAIKEGITFLDTAHGYGHSEECIGEALQGKAREDPAIVLASKSPSLDKAGFLSDLEESLRRLRTDYLDIFQHHNISSEEKLEQVLGPGGAFEGMSEAVQGRQGALPCLQLSHPLGCRADDENGPL